MTSVGSKHATITGLIRLIAVSFIGGTWLSGQATPEAPKTIIFVAGPKDHGAPGRHEYRKDLNVMKYCIDHASNISGVATRIYEGRVPAIASLRNPAAIVLESSGDRTPEETHALFPPNDTTDQKTYDPWTTQRLIQFDDLMKKGTGLAIFHYTTHVVNETAQKYFLDWVGGYYKTGYSKVVMDTWTTALASPSHPVLRGVAPLTYTEEIFTNEVLPADARRIMLVTGKSKGGVDSPIAWVVQREGGGRGFVMAGQDTHKNLAEESNRRLLVNGILWAAHVEVPKEGVSCEIPDDVMK
jgi:type 1 glutamine amidotransferase